MGYESNIDRTGAAALMPEDAANAIIADLPKQSAALTLFRRATMSRKQQRMPALASFPTAYFRNGDTGLAETTKVEWGNVYLNAEEMDCIIPIPVNVLEDSEFDVWGEVRPLAVEAMGRTLDAACFFGTNKPATWPTALNAQAVAAGNVITYATASQATGGIAQDVNALMALIEADGYDVNGFVAPRTFKSAMRALRDSTGQKLLDVTAAGGTYTIEGEQVVFAMDGLWPAIATAGAARLFAADWSKQMLAVRRDITYKMLDQAVIQDAEGNIIYNLAQQNMVAMMLTFRPAWATANPITHSNSTDPCSVGILRTAP